MYLLKRLDRLGQPDGVTARVIHDDGETTLYDAKWTERGQTVVARHRAASSAYFQSRYVTA